MSNKYLFPCECGHQNIVTPSDAGRTISCGSCQAELVLPGMRDIRGLEPAEAGADAPSTKAWSYQKRVLYASGLGALLVGLTIAAIFFYIGYAKFDAQKPDIQGDWKLVSDQMPPANTPLWCYAPEPAPGQPQYEMAMWDPKQEMWTYENNRKPPVPLNYYSRWGDSIRTSIEGQVRQSSIKDLWKFWYETEPKMPLEEWQEPICVINGRFANTFYTFSAVGGVIALIGLGLLALAILKK